MYPVSREFHEQMTANQRRVHARCRIDYTDPFLDQSIDVFVNDEARISYPVQTADSLINSFAKFASLDGSCLSDGACYPAPGPNEAKYTQMGWWGKRLAGNNGLFPFYSGGLPLEEAPGGNYVEYEGTIYLSLTGGNRRVMDLDVSGKSTWINTPDWPSVEELIDDDWTINNRKATETYWTSGEVSSTASAVNNITGSIETGIPKSANLFTRLCRTLPTGTVISSGDGSSGNPFIAVAGQGPTLSVIFSERSIDSLKVVGDNKREEWPVDFEILLYDKDDNVLHTETVTDNEEVFWSKTLNNHVLDVVREELTITRWSHEGRQVKIMGFISSFQESYEEEDIVSIRLIEQQENSQGSLPIGNVSSNEIEIKLFNRDGKFDISNIESPLHGLLKPNRRVMPFLGVEHGEALVDIAWQEEVTQIKENDSERLSVTTILQAQGFMATAEMGSVTHIQAQVKSGGISTRVDTKWTIRKLENNLPGTTISKSPVTILGDNWGGWMAIEFKLTEPLVQGEKYILQGQGQATSGTGVWWSYWNGDVYSDGDMYESTNGGATWNTCAGLDFAFKISVPQKVEIGKEYVPLGVFWTNDWIISDDGLYVRTVGRDRLELLRLSNYEPSMDFVYMDNLYNLTIDVLHHAGLTNAEYWVDHELEQFDMSYAYVPPRSHRDVLRLIAEACVGRVYCDREGIVRVEGPSFTKAEMDTIKNVYFIQGGAFPSEVKTITGLYNISADDYFNKNHSVIWKGMANYVKVETQPMRSFPIEEVYHSNGPVEIHTGQEITINASYNYPSTGASVSLENADVGIEIITEEFFVERARIVVRSTVNGVFELSIMAYPIKAVSGDLVTEQDEKSISEHGLVEYNFSQNPLIQHMHIACLIAEHIVHLYKTPRQNMELDWRGNPALELGDIIQLPVFQRKGVDKRGFFIVTQQELEYDGGLRAKLSGHEVVLDTEG